MASKKVYQEYSQPFDQDPRFHLDQIMLSMDGDIPQPSLTLVETETIFILSIDSSIVANDSKDLETIKQRNERYVEVERDSSKACY